MSLPVLLEVDEWLEFFSDRSEPPTADEVRHAALGVGRNSSPALVYSLFFYGLLTADAATTAVPDAWSGVEFPGQIEPDVWRALFDLAGFTVDGVRAERPTSTQRLWRGALPAHRDGWSWTGDRATAEWFAARPHHRGAGTVWVADVEPFRLLAHIATARDEDEWVVDTDGLEISADSLRTGEAT